MKTTLQILIDAKRRIDRPSKWCKGDTERHGRMCLIGATNFAASGDPDMYIRSTGARKLLEECAGTAALALGFNDLPETTHKDVMRVLDCAIRKAGGK